MASFIDKHGVKRSLKITRPILREIGRVGSLPVVDLLHNNLVRRGEAWRKFGEQAKDSLALVFALCHYQDPTLTLEQFIDGLDEAAIDRMSEAVKQAAFSYGA